MKKLGKKISAYEGTLTAFSSCNCSGCTCNTSQCTCIHNPMASHRNGMTNSGSSGAFFSSTGLGI